MPEQIQTKLIEEEMKQSYIDYAMSVITSRALPDVRDGLKPVHRRILYAMNELSLQHNKPFKKSARIVGEVLGKYHPHGDIAVYDALVRLAQNFSLRYPLVDGQGNFGSVDGDAPAAQRYTEARLTKISDIILEDTEKDTVQFIPNFDNSLKEPTVLPSKIPNLLINGSSGIAVGMATNIPPHNIQEVIDAAIALIDNQEITIEELMNFIHGPDFPTGAFICGSSRIKQAYKTGRGKLILKAKTQIEEKANKKSIIVTEIPYMLNKTVLIEEIASLVRDKKLEGITDLRDESDRKGMRIVIELKQNYNPEVVLNQLFKYTQLKTTFGIIMIALVDNTPRLLNLKELLQHFILHRKEIVTNRCKFELDKSKERAHILLGLKIALQNISPIIRIIKSSDTPTIAKNLLIENFRLTEKQSQAILDMKLQQLTSLETGKINTEHSNLIIKIQDLEKILSSELEIYNVIKNELLEIKKEFSDERKTGIIDEHVTLTDADLIPEEDIVITFTNSGYIKRIPISTYKSQKRGGKGIIGTETKEQDFVENLFVSSTHNDILFFTNFGRLYCLKAYDIPPASRYSPGKAIVNLLNLQKDEKITTMIPVKNYNKGYLVMVTKLGLIKKTPLKYFSKPRKTGIRCIKLNQKDELIKVVQTDGYQKLILASKNGMAIRFDEIDIRPMGRTALGIRGMKLRSSDTIISLDIANDNDTLITVTENGFGKRSKISDYRLIRRGGVGVINIKSSNRNGKVIGVKTVNDSDEILFVTQKGIIMRTKIKNISTIGRNTLGVKLIKLNTNDKLVSIAKILENNKF